MKPSIRKIAVRAGAVTAAAAVAAVIGIAPGGTATAEAGGVACQSGFVCLFARAGNTDDRERYFEFANPNYTTWQWGSYVNGWHLIPNTSIDNDVDAINYNWQIDPIAFYDGYNYRGALITSYHPSDTKGYRNWTSGNINRASSHSLY